MHFHPTNVYKNNGVTIIMASKDKIDVDYCHLSIIILVFQETDAIN